MTDEFANKLRRALDGNADAIFSISTHDFDSWLREVINDAEQAGREAWAETQTAGGLIEAAWEKAHPIPEGRVIPARLGFLRRGKGGVNEARVNGVSYSINPHANDGCEFRTLYPLPPLIPDDCPAVWASTADAPDRRIYLRSPNSDGEGLWESIEDYVTDADLIDPRPIPREDNNE